MESCPNNTDSEEVDDAHTPEVFNPADSEDGERQQFTNSRSPISYIQQTAGNQSPVLQSEATKIVPQKRKADLTFEIPGRRRPQANTILWEQFAGEKRVSLLEDRCAEMFRKLEKFQTENETLKTKVQELGQTQKKQNEALKTKVQELGQTQKKQNEALTARLYELKQKQSEIPPEMKQTIED